MKTFVYKFTEKRVLRSSESSLKFKHTLYGFDVFSLFFADFIDCWSVKYKIDKK